MHIKKTIENPYGHCGTIAQLDGSWCCECNSKEVYAGVDLGAGGDWVMVTPSWCSDCCEREALALASRA